MKSDPDRIATIDERIQMTYDLFKLDNLEMAKVLTMIEDACPSALSRKVSSDEVLINIDGLNPRCFYEVNVFIISCLMQTGTLSKKKKRPLIPLSAANVNPIIKEAQYSKISKKK